MINAIVVAAGNGLRMRNNKKKQYIQVNGIPLLCHALKAFDLCNDIDKIYLTVPKLDMEMCQTHIVDPLKLSRQIKLISGGPTRQSSVLRALKYANNSGGTVMIHDGVRPFLTKKLILRCLNGVKKTGACIPVIPANDSLKKVINNRPFLKTISRKHIWLAQTPQVFDFNLILDAHLWAQKKDFHGTDDSSLVEAIGSSINIVQGDSYNIKITTKDDLILAKAIAKIMLL